MCEGNPGEIDFSSSKQGFELSGMDCTIPRTVTQEYTFLNYYKIYYWSHAILNSM